LSSYINPGGAVPPNFFTEDDDESDSESAREQPQLPLLFHDLLQQSCLLPAVSSYLRNDSGKAVIETEGLSHMYCTHVQEKTLGFLNILCV
jgi:baculoviral IAP repeat-containing protein 6